MTTSGGKVTFAVNEGLLSTVEKSSQAMGVNVDMQAIVFIAVLALIPISVLGVLAYMSAAKDEVETEIREVKHERDGFRAFRTRIESLPATTEATVGRSNSLQILDTRDAPISLIRSAFEETVLTLPHYREAYGDDVDTNLALELDPELVAGLHHQVALTPVLKRTLRVEAREATANREGLLAELRAERNALNRVESDVDGVLSELRSMNRRPLKRKDFAQLRSDHVRLVDLRDELRSISEERQTQIHRMHRKFRLSFDEPTLQEYLYQGRDVTYPILATLVRLDRMIEGARSNIVRAVTKRV